MIRFLKQRKYYLSLLLGLVLLFLLLGRSSASVSQTPDRVFEQVRAIETADSNLPNPAGLAYSPLADSLLVLDASTLGVTGDSDVFMIGRRHEELNAVIHVSAAITDPALMTFDPSSNALYYYDEAGRQLVQIQADEAGVPGSSPEAITWHDLASLNLGQVRGITFDPATGELFLLDAAARQVVKISPDPEPALPITASRTSGSSWVRYWCAMVSPTLYLRSSDSMLAILSVVKFWNSSI